MLFIKSACLDQNSSKPEDRTLACETCKRKPIDVPILGCQTNRISITIEGNQILNVMQLDAIDVTAVIILNNNCNAPYY